MDHRSLGDTPDEQGNQDDQKLAAYSRPPFDEPLQLRLRIFAAYWRPISHNDLTTQSSMHPTAKSLL